MANKTDKRIAALERKIKKLEAAQAPPPPSFVPESDAEYRDRVHQMRERAANNFQFRPEILREMEKACGTEDLRDLVHASHRPQGPSQGGIPGSSMITGVHPGGGASVPGGGTGWRTAAPLGPPPGINYVDRLVDEQDRRDREELAQRLGKK
jgi:hypothetical protein